MFCPNCGVENPDSAAACRRCRVPLHDEPQGQTGEHAAVQAEDLGRDATPAEPHALSQDESLAHEPDAEEGSPSVHVSDHTDQAAVFTEAPAEEEQVGEAEEETQHAAPADDAHASAHKTIDAEGDDPGSTHALAPVRVGDTPAEGSRSISDELSALELSPEDARAARGEDATPADGSPPLVMKTAEHKLDAPAPAAGDDDAPALVGADDEERTSVTAEPTFEAQFAARALAASGSAPPSTLSRPPAASSASAPMSSDTPAAPVPAFQAEELLHASTPPVSTRIPLPARRAAPTAMPLPAPSAPPPVSSLPPPVAAEKICASCSSANLPNAKFCAECGTPFPKLSVAPIPLPAPKPPPSIVIDPESLSASADEHTPAQGAPSAHHAESLHAAMEAALAEHAAQHEEPAPEVAEAAEVAHPIPEPAKPARTSFDPQKTDQALADSGSEHTAEQVRVALAEELRATEALEHAGQPEHAEEPAAAAPELHGDASDADDPHGVAPLSFSSEHADENSSLSIESVHVAAEVEGEQTFESPAEGAEYADPLAQEPLAEEPVHELSSEQPPELAEEEPAHEAGAEEVYEPAPEESGEALAEDEPAMLASEELPAEEGAVEEPAEEGAVEEPASEEGGVEAAAEEAPQEEAAPEELPQEELAAEEPVEEPAPEAVELPYAVQLVVEQGAQAGTTFHLAALENGIGGAGAAVELGDDAHLAQLHATVLFEEHRLMLRDEGTVNGVYLKLRDAAVLEAGDQFIAGQRLLRFDGPVELQSAEGEPLQGAPRPAGVPFRIVEVLAGGKSGRSCHRSGPIIAVGKSGCDLNFGGDALLAPRHAEIHLGEDGTAQLIDMGAGPSGVLLRVRQNASIELQAGDVLQLGDHTLRVELEQPA